MACPCCDPGWLCVDCCCPNGSTPPSSITLAFSNLRYCDQNDVGGEFSGGRLYAPPDLFRFATIEGSYSLKQDVYGPFKRLEPRTNRLIEGAIAGNCVNYSYSQGVSIRMTAGRWPPTLGTFYWFFFSGGDMSMEGVFLGDYDICSNVGRRFDIRAAFELLRNGSAIKVTGAGRQWSVYACVDVTISK